MSIRNEMLLISIFYKLGSVTSFIRALAVKGLAAEEEPSSTESKKSPPTMSSVGKNITFGHYIFSMVICSSARRPLMYPPLCFSLHVQDTR